MLKIRLMVLILLALNTSGSGFINNQLPKIVTDASINTPFSGNILVSGQNNLFIHESIGFASKEFNIDNTADTKFLIASLSKQITAAAIYILAKNGKLQITDRISRYIPESEINPELKTKWSQITIKDILNHQAGLLKDVQTNDNFSLQEKHSLTSVTKHIISNPQLLSKKYGVFSYSNVGYILLAHIIEKTSKFKFEDFLSYYIFKPLNMNSTGVYHRSKIIPLLANGYISDEDSRLTKHCCTDSSIYTGSHNLYSTTNDLLIWIKEITTFNKIIPRKFLDDLISSQAVVSKKLYYANGLFIDKTKNEFHIWHDGYDAGYTSLISYYPTKDLTIIILSNFVDVFTTTTQINKIHEEIVKTYN